MTCISLSSCSQSRSCFWFWIPWLLLALNAILAVWVVFFIHPMETAIFSDMEGYASTAQQLTYGKYHLNHLFQPIGFPLWMSLLRDIREGGWGLLKLSHVFFVVSSVYLGWQTARRLLPAKWDIAVLLLLSLHVQWLQLASFAMPEALYIFLLTALLWFTVRWVENSRVVDAAMVGLLFGIGFYVKGSAVFFPPALLLWAIICIVRNKLPLHPTIGHLAIMAIFALSVALSHGFFTQVKYGQFKLGAETGGLNFVEGKCVEKHNIDSRGHVWLSPLHAYLGEIEEKHWDVPFSNQAYFWHQGWECVKENPVVVLTSLRYIYYLFTGNPLWPTEAKETYYEALFSVAILPLFLIGLIAAVRRWDKSVMVPALFLLSLFLTAWIFKSELRYRVPFDAMVMIYAVLGARIVWLGLRQNDIVNNKSEFTKRLE